MTAYDEIARITGLKKHTLKILSVLKDGKEHTSYEIERETMMRQPSVSQGLAELKREFIGSWFEYGTTKNRISEKGRPEITIRLAIPFDELKENIKNRMAHEFDMDMKSFERFEFPDVMHYEL